MTRPKHSPQMLLNLSLPSNLLLNSIVDDLMLPKHLQRDDEERCGPLFALGRHDQIRLGPRPISNDNMDSDGVLWESAKSAFDCT